MHIFKPMYHLVYYSVNYCTNTHKNIFSFTGKGTSSNPCNENFRGTQPFSEKEVLAMAEYMWTLQGRMNIYLSLHSYGQYWLTPWGYTYRVPTDFADLVCFYKTYIHMYINKYTYINVYYVHTYTYIHK